LEQNCRADMDLTDCVVIGKLHSCNTDQAKDEEVGEVFRRDNDTFSIEEEENEKKCECCEGQTDEDQFSRRESNVEKGFGDYARYPPKRCAYENVEVASNFSLSHWIRIMT